MSDTDTDSLTIDMLKNNQDRVKELYRDKPLHLYHDIDKLGPNDFELIDQFSPWINDNTLDCTVDEPNAGMSDLEKPEIKIVSLADPLFGDVDMGLGGFKTYLINASSSMFQRFGIELNDEDQRKFAEDLFEYFQEQRDVPISPFFNERKPDNKVSQYITGSGNNNITLFEKYVLDVMPLGTDQYRKIVLWFLISTVTMDTATGKTSMLAFRI